MSVTVALDTSTALTCVGLSSSDGTHFEVFDVPAEGEAPRHATKALPLIQELLDKADSTWQDISKVVVGVGPGSFTGLRVGLATAIGLAEGSGSALSGVSGLSALLFGLSPGQPGCGLIDARRGELYAASSNDPTKLICIKRDLVGIPIASPAVCIGDGAVLERENLARLGFEVPNSESHHHRISPLQMIAAEAAGLGVAPVEPQYVRAADAIPTSERHK